LTNYLKIKIYFLAFREYLYQQLAHENLSFYVEAVNFETLTEEEQIAKRAKEIFDKFIGPQAVQPINLEFMTVEKLKKNLTKPTPQAFKSVTEKIWKVLTNEWFPDFVVSPLYLACNDETIEYVKSDGGRKRTDTIVQYDMLCERLQAEKAKTKEKKKSSVSKPEKEKKAKEKEG